MLKGQAGYFTNALEDIEGVKKAIRERHRLRREEIEMALGRYEDLVAAAHNAWKRADPFGWPGSVVFHIFGKDIPGYRRRFDAEEY